MKKLFTLLAMVGLAFASCTPAEDDGKTKSEGGNEFAIEVSNIGEYGATVTVTPKDESRTYYWAVTKYSNLAAVGTSKEYMAYVHEYLQALVGNGASWTEGDDALLSAGVSSWEYKELSPETEYMVYVFGVDANGNLTSTDLSYTTFTTLKSTFDTSAWVGTWNVTSPKVYVQQINAATEKYEEFFLDSEEGFTKPIQIVDGATFDLSLAGYCVVYGWDGYFGMEGPAIGVYSGNKIELLNNEVVYEDPDQGMIAQWQAQSAVPDMGYESGVFVGGEYPPYTFKMDAEGNVTIEAYAGELTSGALFNVVSFNIWPVVGEDIYVWTYTEPVYTFSGDVMTAVKLAEDNGGVAPAKLSAKNNIKVMHKMANQKFVAKKFTAARFVK